MRLLSEHTSALMAPRQARSMFCRVRLPFHICRGKLQGQRVRSSEGVRARVACSQAGPLCVEAAGVPMSPHDQAMTPLCAAACCCAAASCAACAACFCWKSLGRLATARLKCSDKGHVWEGPASVSMLDSMQNGGSGRKGQCWHWGSSPLEAIPSGRVHLKSIM